MSLATFYQWVPRPYSITRASKDAVGTLPNRHGRCEPVRVASSMGWHIYLPFDFSLQCLGPTDLLMSIDGEMTWFPVSSTQLPGAWEAWERHAPPELLTYSQGVRSSPPPFVSAVEDAFVVQIWTGYLLKTAPGWSSWIRSPVNYAVESVLYQHLEGVIETDHWLGPLFTNIRIIRTDVPIRFFAHRPFVQVIPVPRGTLRDETQNAFVQHATLAGMGPEDWELYRRSIIEPNDPVLGRKPGHYAAQARRRAKQDHAVLIRSPDLMTNIPFPSESYMDRVGAALKNQDWPWPPVLETTVMRTGDHAQLSLVLTHNGVVKKSLRSNGPVERPEDWEPLIEAAVERVSKGLWL